MNWLFAILNWLFPPKIVNHEPIDYVPVDLTPPPPPPPKYQWDTTEHIKASIRKICKESGLTTKQTNDLVATVGAESNYKIKAINHNKKNGKIVSTDHSLIQVNDYYHIGDGKAFPSVPYVYANPEQQIRWMARQWKAGHANWWIAFKNGSYKAHL